MNIYELAEKVGGEIVGGRLIGVVDGKKQYLSEVGSDGQAFLTAAGLLLANEPIPEVTVEEVAAVTEEAPKRKKKNEAGVETDDIQIEI
jgi:hypothetical protein